MPRPNLIGASNRQTNRTSVFGSLAGLAPTTGVRPHVTGLNGYKFARIAANGLVFKNGSQTWVSENDHSNGCGFNRDNNTLDAPRGRDCIKHIGFSKNVSQFRIGKSMLG